MLNGAREFMQKEHKDFTFIYFTLYNATHESLLYDMKLFSLLFTGVNVL